MKYLDSCYDIYKNNKINREIYKNYAQLNDSIYVENSIKIEMHLQMELIYNQIQEMGKQKLIMPPPILKGNND